MSCVVFGALLVQRFALKPTRLVGSIINWNKVAGEFVSQQFYPLFRVARISEQTFQ
jgi:hypothetical protein